VSIPALNALVPRSPGPRDFRKVAIARRDKQDRTTCDLRNASMGYLLTVTQSIPLLIVNYSWSANLLPHILFLLLLFLVFSSEALDLYKRDISKHVTHFCLRVPVKLQGDAVLPKYSDRA
jgi:hypothetical protein